MVQTSLHPWWRTFNLAQQCWRSVFQPPCARLQVDPRAHADSLALSRFNSRSGFFGSTASKQACSRTTSSACCCPSVTLPSARVTVLLGCVPRGFASTPHNLAMDTIVESSVEGRLGEEPAFACCCHRYCCNQAFANPILKSTNSPASEWGSLHLAWCT